MKIDPVQLTHVQTPDPQKPQDTKSALFSVTQFVVTYYKATITLYKA